MISDEFKYRFREALGMVPTAEQEHAIDVFSLFMTDRSNSVRLLPTGRKNGNPHCHLVYNRINNEGKIISDQNDFRRNEQVTKLIKRKYGLTFSKGKYKTKTERLRGCEKTKYEIHHLVMSAASESI